MKTYEGTSQEKLLSLSPVEKNFQAPGCLLLVSHAAGDGPVLLKCLLQVVVMMF